MDTYDRYATLRDEKGYTDYRVCKLANIESSTISSWKTKRYEPKIQTLKKIANVLECNIYDFYENGTENKENVIIDALWLVELESRFNHLVSLLGTVDIGTMKEIVYISEMIEDMQGNLRKEKYERIRTSQNADTD